MPIGYYFFIGLDVKEMLGELIEYEMTVSIVVNSMLPTFVT